MPRLFITAKQSVARAIGSALAGKARELEKREDHFRIIRADGELDLLTWCGGHLLEMAPPHFYDGKYKKWRLEDLPVIPEGWRWVEADAQEHPDLARQLGFIRQSLPQVSVVIHAGDPDREGQWLIDEVLLYSDYSGPVQRLRLKDLNWRLLRSALKVFEGAPPDNQHFKTLSITARTRSRIDWLYGMNMTRAYTLLGKHAGYENVLSVGRVQTPLLGMVVKRDESIECFTPQYHYGLEAKFRKAEAFCYATLRFDEKLSIDAKNKDAMELLVNGLRGKPARLARREKQHHFQSPPLLLDLSTLQIECSEVFGYSGIEVLKIAKRLYEEFHLITYPLTDCRYAPEKFREHADIVLEAVIENISTHGKHLKPMLEKSDVWRRSAVWNNSKLTQHYGIMPTDHKLDEKILLEKERNVYELIIRYYAAQFFPDLETLEDESVFFVNGYYFHAHKNSIVERGWRVVIPDAMMEKMDFTDFPSWAVGDDVLCENVEIKIHKSIPPPRFTEASLMAAMKEIAPFIENKEVLHRFDSSDGIGTEVTRAHMIDTLFKRGYLIKGNKSIYSSGIGRDLIRALPAEAVSVDMTALWEKELSRIETMSIQDAEKIAENLMREVEDRIRYFIFQAQQKKNITVHSPDEILGIEHQARHHCPRCHSVLQLRNGRYGPFWGCSAYPACEYTARQIN